MLSSHHHQECPVAGCMAPQTGQACFPWAICQPSHEGTAGPRWTCTGLGCFLSHPVLSSGVFSHMLQVPFQWLSDKKWDGVWDLFNN